MKTNILLTHKKEISFIAPKRLVHIWSEVAHFPSLKGQPNAEEFKYKKGNKDVYTENPDTSKGRNIIRGQAILMLKKFPFEAGSSELNDLIMISRCVELNVPIPEYLLINDADALQITIPQLSDQKFTVDEKKAMALVLKTALNGFRNDHTKVITPDATKPEKTKTVFKAPSKIEIVNSNLLVTTEGRNYIRGQAIKWLKTNPKPDKSKDEDAYDLWNAIKDNLESSTKYETGQIYNEKDKDGNAIEKPKTDGKIGDIGKNGVLKILK